MGTHMRILSESFPMNTNMTGFRWFTRIFASLCFGWKSIQHWKGLTHLHWPCFSYPPWSQREIPILMSACLWCPQYWSRALSHSLKQQPIITHVSHKGLGTIKRCWYWQCYHFNSYRIVPFHSLKVLLMILMYVCSYEWYMYCRYRHEYLHACYGK